MEKQTLIELGSPKRIVIIDPAFLGDTVFNGPLIRELRNRLPDAQIDIVVRPPSDQIASYITGIGRVHRFDKRNEDSGISGLRRMAKQISAEKYELAIIPHPSVRSTLLATLAKIPRRIGLATGLAGLFLTEQVKTPRGESFVNQRLRLIGAHTVDGALSGTMRNPEQKISSKHHTRIGLFMGSAWPTKCWSNKQAQELLRSLDDERYEFVFLGAEWERDHFEGLFELGAHTKDRLGLPLAQMLGEIAACDLVIAGDTGPLHMARALSIPVIALFGPSFESRHEFGVRDVVLTENVACRPCSPHGHKKCPLGHHQCMEELAASRVREAVLQVIPL